MLISIPQLYVNLNRTCSHLSPSLPTKRINLNCENCEKILSITSQFRFHIMNWGICIIFSLPGLESTANTRTSHCWVRLLNLSASQAQFSQSICLPPALRQFACEFCVFVVFLLDWNNCQFTILIYTQLWTHTQTDIHDTAELAFIFKLWVPHTSEALSFLHNQFQ
jgi:hypothetical protein